MKLRMLSRGVAAALVVGAGLTATAMPASAAAANDGVTSAASLVPGSSALANNFGATLESGEPQPACLAAGDATASTLWYRIRVDQPSTIVLSTFGSKIDTTLAVFTGNPTRINRLAAVACNDDVEELGSLQSRTLFAAAAFRTYLVQVGSLNGQTGRIKLSAAIDPKPMNDAVGDATRIATLPYSTSGDLTHATAEATERSCDYSVTASVWYRYTAVERTLLKLTATAENYASAAIYRADNTISALTCRDLYPDSASALRADIEPGDYLIQVAASQYDIPGPFGFTLESIPFPTNDDFDSPTVITPGTTTTQSLDGATVEPGEPLCYRWDQATVWFSLVADKSGSLTVSTAGSDFTPTVGVYTVAPAGGLTRLACSNTAISGGPVAFAAQAGRQYFVQVGREDYENSQLNMSINGPTV